MKTNDNNELWGAFSVMDHLLEGAYLPEVIMYDKLVIPVPPDPEKAETPEDRNFALKQWKCWEDNHWEPDRQTELLKILEPVTVKVEWNRQRHERWAETYEISSRAAARENKEPLPGWKTGKTLLWELPKIAPGIIAISPYDSLVDLKFDFGITEQSSIQEQIDAGKGLPGELVSIVIGREFLVPDDPEKDEFYQLQKAVELVTEPYYREARKNYHAAQQQFIRDGKTDLISVNQAVEAMNEHLEILHELAQKQKISKVIEHAYFFTQLTTDFVKVPINPVIAGKAVIGIGKFTANHQFGSPANPGNPWTGGALLFDLRQEVRFMK